MNNPTPPAQGQYVRELPGTRLGPAERAAALERLRANRFDVLVVGGGVTGCGVALDAATRGLSVALVEQTDLAAGTSSRSGKLIHGGLRYLEQLNFALVAEALRERALMLRTLCPHLVRPVRFVYPLTHRGWERGYVGAGVALYDAIGGAGAVPRHRHLSRRGARTLAPALRAGALTGAITFYDAQVDDARHTMMLARTAAGYGATIATGVRVTGLCQENGTITGARVHDAESGTEFDIAAGHVIAAAGVWTDALSELTGREPELRVRASKGVHIMVPREKIASDAAILVRAEDSVLFIRPWGAHWLIGTTDTPWPHDRAHPAATESDVDYLLRNVNRVIEPPLTRADVTGVFAGLRPLLHGRAASTSRLSREHAVTSPAPGMTVVTGGKYTTYRVMAADAVDAAGLTTTPSCTAEVPLLGADGYRALRNALPRRAAEHGLDEVDVTRLLHRYGSASTEVFALLDAEPVLRQHIPGAPGYLLAEARYAASHEGALHLDDVLSRRTHIAIETADGGHEAAQPVAEAIAPVLGWGAETTAAEVAHYRAQLAAEHAAAAQPDDAAADAARAAVRDQRLRGNPMSPHRSVR